MEGQDQTERVRPWSFFRAVDSLGGVKHFDRSDRKMHVRLLVLLSLLIAIPVTPLVIYTWFSGSDTGAGFYLSAALTFVFWTIIPVLRVTKSIRKTSWYFLLLGASPIALVALIRGGIHSPAVIYLMIGPVVGGLLLGRNGTLASFVINMVFIGLYIIMEPLGWQFGQPYTPEQVYIFLSTNYLITLTILTASTAYFLTLSERWRQQLNSAKEAAETANRAKSSFLATMSHEIRTPLNGVLGMADILMNSELTDVQKQRMQIIHNSGASLLGVINDILDLSKLETGNIELEVAAIDPLAVVQASLDLISAKAEEKGLTTTITVDAPIPGILGDSFRLQQALVNLIGNAVKFTRHGKITVSLSHQLQADNTLEVRFEVSDTGIGISQEALETIFEPFVQADSSTSRTHGGSGLGLNICKRLVELMGGEIGATSRTGQGSTFFFTIVCPLASVQRPSHSNTDTLLTHSARHDQTLPRTG